MKLVVQYLHFKHFVEQLEVIWFKKKNRLFPHKTLGLCTSKVQVAEGRGGVLLEFVKG